MLSDVLVDNSGSLSLLDGGEDVSGLLGLSCGGNLSLLLLLLSKFNIVVLSIELLEGSCVDLNNRVLDDGLGSDELVVGGVVDHIQDSGLAGESLGSPNVVALIDAEGSELEISTAATDLTDLLGAELGGDLALEQVAGSLLLMNWHASTSCSSLVSRVPVDSHDYFML